MFYKQILQAAKRKRSHFSMNSLHDLIYGHEEQQQPQAPLPSSNNDNGKKKLSRKRILTDTNEHKICINNNNKEQHPTTASAAPSIVQRMNLLYNQPASAATSDDYLQDLQSSLNPPVAHTTLKTGKGKQRTMTLERRAKQERKNEWRHIRQQWKRRQINYRDEADVGGVLQQVFLQNPSTSQQKEKEEPLYSPEHHAEIIDTSDEEEEAILRQLTQANGQSEIKKKRKLEEEKERIQKNDIFISFQEKMNFHDRGLVQPDDLDPLRQYEHQKRAVVQQFSKNSTNYSKHPGEAITLRRIRVVHRLNPQESTFPPLDHNLYSSPQFAHKRQVLRLAARYLLASGRHKDYHTNLIVSRLISYLWNSDILDASDASLIRHLARETATRHQMFWSHVWKNRGEMAKVLGVSKEMQVAGPYAGYRLDANGFSSKRKEMLKLRKTQSRGSISAGALRSNGSRASASRQRDVELLPTVLYAFTPGTIPPVPQYPLDESGVVLGPPDKFSNYITSRVVIAESTLTITSAHLLAIFAANIKSNTSTEDIHIQIQSTFRKTIDLNRKIAHFASMSTAEDDWPLPHVYKSWMGYLSLVMNGLLLSEDSQSEEDLEITIKCGQPITGSFLDESLTSYSNVRETAAEFYELYQHVDQAVGLERFGDYHLVNGLLRIAKDLPEDAARLLAQPPDEKSDGMPFELMHSILVYLEQGGMLTEKTSKNVSNSVSVIELEYAMYQASQIFLKCVERDPSELKFHCWHLATLASSLLLCSGNRVGSGPCLESSSGQDNGDHTVRQPLPKFQETRRDTARALYLLFQLASKQRGQAQVALSSDVHLAVSKFLEWHDVVALLIGSPCWAEKIRALETIHRFHSHIWAYSCVDTCQLLSVQAEDQSVRIEAAARALEQDPSCKQNWRVLALELGAVGCRPSLLDLNTKRFCVEKECSDCCILVQDSFIDHDQEKGDRESTKWWGRDRKQWWQYCVLNLKNPSQRDIGLINRTDFFKSLELGLSSITVHQPAARWVEKGLDAATLDRFYDTLTDVDSRHPEDDHIISGPVSQYLPKSSSETFSQMKEDIEGRNSFLAFAPGTDHDLLEVECYQIIIASHLHGPSHRWVQSKILQLAAKSWDRKAHSIKEDSVEWAALKWLYQMGISAANAVKVAIKLHGRKQTPKV